MAQSTVEKYLWVSLFDPWNNEINRANARYGNCHADTAIDGGKIQIAPENYFLYIRSEKAAFMVFAILCLIVIFISFARGRIK